VTAVALLLVLVSAATHAYWNFLLKQAGGTRPFIALSKACEAVVFFPVFAAIAWRLPAGTLAAVAPLAAVATVLVLASYATLGAAYRIGDLSFAYPIARGASLVILPPLGWLAFNERIGPVGLCAVVVIVLGVLTMQLPELTPVGLRALGGRLRGAPMAVALLMAFLIALNTIWDKYSIRTVPLFTYFYTYTTATAACYLVWSLRGDGAPALRGAWAAHRWSVIGVGVLNTVSYGLALAALRTGGSTYVIGLRQLSIVGGVWLGARVLGERVDAPRRVGVTLLVVGCALMALGR
jgi:drug/metabolite transporter (DMT)-like permease